MKVHSCTWQNFYEVNLWWLGTYALSCCGKKVKLYLEFSSSTVPDRSIKRLNLSWVVLESQPAQESSTGPIQIELNRWSQFSEQKLSEKWKFEKVLLIKNDGHIGYIYTTKNRGSCHHLLSVYDASKLSTVYVVKWSVLGLQQAPKKSEFAPSG